MTSDEQGPVWLTTDRSVLRMVREILAYDGAVLLAVVSRDGAGPAVLVASDEAESSVFYVVADITEQDAVALERPWDPGQVRDLIMTSSRVTRVQRRWAADGTTVVSETPVDPSDLSEDELPAPSR